MIVTAALDSVLGALPDARRSGSGWTARCRAHEDRQASLSIAAGTSRDVVLTCFTGCQPDDIIRALGLAAFPSQGGSMPTPGTEPPISSLSDARACVGAGLAALDTVVDWVAQRGHDDLARALRRRTQDVAVDFADGLDLARDLDDDPPGDDA